MPKDGIWGDGSGDPSEAGCGAFLIQPSGVRFEYPVAAAGLLASGLFFILSKDVRSLRSPAWLVSWMRCRAGKGAMNDRPASLKRPFPISIMGTTLETAVDERGRVLIPQELREEAGLEEGTIVKVERGRGQTIQITPVKGGVRPTWKDLNGTRPRRRGKPECPTPEEIKGIWE